MSNLMIDIGSSTAAFGQTLAEHHPDRWIVVIDESLEAALETIPRGQKRRSAGGAIILPSLSYLPSKLTQRAMYVSYLFPTGQTLEQLVQGQKEAWDPLYSICLPGALLDLVLGYGEKDANHLNETSIHTELLPRLKEHHFHHINAYPFSPAQASQHPSAWSQRLSFGKGEGYFFLRLRRS